MQAEPPPPLPLLRSRLQADLLTLVLLNPGHEWTLTELGRRTGASVATVGREMIRAEEDDVQDAIRVATQAKDAAVTILGSGLLTPW